MTQYTIRNENGDFIGHIYADRIEPAIFDNQCAYFWVNDNIIAGVGSREIGVHVFLDDKEVIGTPAYQPSIEDFYQEAEA